jgi:hypothetical protein
MKLEKIGAGPETRCEHVNAVETFMQILLPNGAEPLAKRFNQVLNVDKPLLWQQLADEFDPLLRFRMRCRGRS